MKRLAAVLATIALGCPSAIAQMNPLYWCVDLVMVTVNMPSNVTKTFSAVSQYSFMWAYGVSRHHGEYIINSGDNSKHFSSSFSITGTDTYPDHGWDVNLD